MAFSVWRRDACFWSKAWDQLRPASWLSRHSKAWSRTRYWAVFLLWPFLGCGLRCGKEIEAGRRRFNLRGDSSEFFTWRKLRALRSRGFVVSVQIGSTHRVSNIPYLSFTAFTDTFWQWNGLHNVRTNTRATIGKCVTIPNPARLKFAVEITGISEYRQFMLKISRQQSTYNILNSAVWLRASFCRPFCRNVLPATGKGLCLFMLHEARVSHYTSLSSLIS